MDAEPPNPYAPPREVACPPATDEIAQEALPPIPPLTPLRLALGLIVITVGWLASWAQWHHQFVFGIHIFGGGCFFLSWLVGPRRAGDLKPFHAVLIVGAFIAFIGWFWSGARFPAGVKAALLHPLAFITAWAISCGFLLRNWWKRRNNPRS